MLPSPFGSLCIGRYRDIMMLMQPNQDNDTWQPPSEPDQTPQVASPANHPTEELPSPAPADADKPSASDEPVHWQAQEYVHYEKKAPWFLGFGVVVAVLMAAAIFLMQSLTFAILIPVMAAALLVYTYRPPRVLDYTLSRQGLHVNDHLYSFNEFKGFGVIHDGDEYSIMLIPIKRFRPGVSVYFPEEAGEAIVDMLGARLPMQEHHLDIVDQIIKKLRI
jgi:hypothetical protein